MCCFKQKTAYEMRISDWSSDVCYSDLRRHRRGRRRLSPYRRDGRAFRAQPDHWPGRGRRAAQAHEKTLRSEERLVGQECVSTFRSLWSPSPYIRKQHLTDTSPLRLSTLIIS